jgi:uncharacterized Fe-S radical SAM superfamily protein PflX|tara:strand:- start:2063 stop:2209 length:147 start_codon:yes stop_codon:yes gene_type:complete
MIDYNIVKHCRWCKVRFVVNKKEAKKIFCDKCQIKANKEYGSTYGGKK